MLFSIRDIKTKNKYNIWSHNCCRAEDNEEDHTLCKQLECVKNLEYLGIFLDNNLTFKEHIKQLSNRIRKLIYIYLKI